MKAAFIGFGELGHQLLALVRTLHDVSTVAAFDDICPNTDPDIPRFAFDDFRFDEFHDYSFVIGLGYEHMVIKHRLVQQLIELHRDLPSLCHPSSYVDPSATIGMAVYLYPMCTIDRHAHISHGCLLNNAVTVSHDAVIGECSYLSPSVTLSGRVAVGARSFLGTGAVVSDGVAIGDDVRIGIGSVVTQNIPSGKSAIGNPLRILDKHLRLVK